MATQRIVNHTAWFKPEHGAAWQPTRTGLYEVTYALNGLPPEQDAPLGAKMLHYDVSTGRWSVWRPRSKASHMIEAHTPLAWRGLTSEKPEYRKVIERKPLLIDDEQQSLPLTPRIERKTLKDEA
jgi:hypothetical protein